MIGFSNNTIQQLQVLLLLIALLTATVERKVEIIYLNLQKASDKVSHERLVKKLYTYGIGGKFLDGMPF